MAVDEAILGGILDKESPPTLRLYSWDPPCLSLGYAQSASDVDMTRLHERAWHLVRRPTGGRAILHTDELTYSVIGPLDDARLVGSVLQSYKRLSQALLAALHQMGIPASAHSLPSLPAGSDPKGPVCFEAPSNYEITVDGKKLVGSAQARRREGVLQHGSLPLYGDLARITQVLNFDSETGRAEAARRVLGRACTASQVLGHPLSWESAAGSFIRAFQDILNLRLVASELTPIETTRAERLEQEKYAHPSWNERV